MRRIQNDASPLKPGYRRDKSESSVRLVHEEVILLWIWGFDGSLQLG